MVKFQYVEYFCFVSLFFATVLRTKDLNLTCIL